MRIAHIYKGRIRRIFTADNIPVWPPYFDGTKPLLIDVTDRDAEVNYPYDVETDTIYSDPDQIQRQNIQDVKTEQLSILRSEPYQLRAESDFEFAEKVRLSIEEWEKIENQAGYPDNIDWPEIWEETLE